MWWSGTVHAVLRGRDASTWLADRQRGSPLGLSYTLHGTQVSLRRSWRPRGARVEETFGTLGPQPNPPPDPQACVTLGAASFFLPPPPSQQLAVIRGLRQEMSARPSTPPS